MERHEGEFMMTFSFYCWVSDSFNCFQPVYNNLAYWNRWQCADRDYDCTLIWQRQFCSFNIKSNLDCCWESVNPSSNVFK